MPRRARLELPNVPWHITHRGVNRAALFVDDDDRQTYRALLHRFAREHEVMVHAYVLMGNHIHLLAGAEHLGAMTNTMRRTAQCYVQAFNRRHGRTGTLWEGRFKSCLVQTDRYILELYRYIELNPVRACIVERPDHYSWSSVHANLLRRADELVTPHPVYQTLADTPQGRADAYAAWLREAFDPDTVASIREHIAQERAYGDQRFQAMVERALGRPASVRRVGRPALRKDD